VHPANLDTVYKDGCTLGDSIMELIAFLCAGEEGVGGDEDDEADYESLGI
jgi:hypothetical protein